MGTADLESKSILREIANLLQHGGESRTAQMIHAVLDNGNEADIERFLTSNEIWGGAGSIADQSMVSDATQRGILEGLLLNLGKLQLASGKTNPRTEMWVRAFEQWRRR